MKKSKPIFLAIIFLAFSIGSFAQTNLKNKFYMGANPFAPVELIGAIGPSLYYFVSNKFSILAETHYIFGSIHNKDNNFRGGRFILQPRYFLVDDILYLGADLRFKNFKYAADKNIFNQQGTFLLQNIKSEQRMIGTALIFGSQFSLNKKATLLLDLNIGLGAKNRKVQHHLPNGFEINWPEDYVWYNSRASETSGTTVYVPCAIRLLAKL